MQNASEWFVVNKQFINYEDVQAIFFHVTYMVLDKKKITIVSLVTTTF